MVTGTLQFYDVVVAVHVMAVVIGLGSTFAEPVVMPWLRRNHPEAMADAYDAQVRLYRFLVTPFMVLLLATGIYLASDRDLWSETWVTVPLVIIVVLFGLTGAFFIPRSKRLAAIARDELSSGGRLGPAFDAALRPIQILGPIAGILVLVAIFFMVAKP